MNNSSSIKRESIQYDQNRIAINTINATASMSYSTRMKRSRKAAHPSKTVKKSTQTSYTKPLVNSTFQMEVNEPLTTSLTSTDDELSNFPQFDQIEEQDNKDEVNSETNGESSSKHQSLSSRRPRLNYNKRLEANARERERVHNLTAAFEALRQVIPMYGDQPKLSRLSILRIACAYVHVLGALNQIDFSQEQNAYTLNESFHMLSCTILNELKRKKTYS